MKLIGTIFRFLCALLVLLAVFVYIDGSLQVSLLEYIKSFTPEKLMAYANLESAFAIAVGALLLLTFCSGLKLGWNIVYSLATLVFFTEAAVLALGPEMVMPTAIKGLGWEALVGGVACTYPVAALMVTVLCVLGCFCSTAPVRIALRALICCALCYGLAELLSLGVQHWAAMQEPVLPQVLAFAQAYPWVLAALPAIFLVQYCLFMAMFEAFIPRKKKAVKDAEDTEKKDAATPAATTPAAPKAEKPAARDAKAAGADDKKPASAATVSVTPTKVVVKRPVIHKKSPISPTEEEKKAAKAEAPAEEKKEEAPKAEAPAEEKKEDAPKAEAPAEEKKEEAPKAEAPAEEKKEEAPKAEAPAEEKKEEPAEDEVPTAPIPSVPLPPQS